MDSALCDSKLPMKVLWVRPPPRVPVEGRRDQLQSEAVSGIEARAGETQIAGRSRGCAGGGDAGRGEVAGEILKQSCSMRKFVGQSLLCFY